MTDEPAAGATAGEPQEDAAATAAAHEENRALREQLSEKDREIFLLKVPASPPPLPVAPGTSAVASPCS